MHISTKDILIPNIDIHNRIKKHECNYNNMHDEFNKKTIRNIFNVIYKKIYITIEQANPDTIQLVNENPKIKNI